MSTNNTLPSPEPGRRRRRMPTDKSEAMTFLKEGEIVTGQWPGH